MLEKADLNCVNCGAVIDRRTMKCEYCGTEYKSDGVKLPVLPDYIPPKVETLYCAVSINPLFDKDLELARQQRMDCIAKGLAKEILKYIEFETTQSPFSFEYILKGRIKIVTSCD
jgi:predicted amidophosphoribosyltransferase